jgi:pyridoxine 5-phosphate synthase
MIEGLKQTGTDRIELYTEAFAHEYGLGNKSGIDPYVKAAILLMNWDWESMQDTSLDNIRFFKENIRLA